MYINPLLKPTDAKTNAVLKKVMQICQKIAVVKSGWVETNPSNIHKHPYLTSVSMLSV